MSPISGVIFLWYSHNYLFFERLLLGFHLVALAGLIALLPSFCKRYLKGLLNKADLAYLGLAILLFLTLSFSHSPFSSLVFFDEQQYVSGSFFILHNGGFFNCQAGTLTNCQSLIPIPHGVAYSFLGAPLALLSDGSSASLELLMRCLNLAFSILSIVCFFYLVRSLYGRGRYGVIATLLFAISPLLTIYSTTTLVEPSTLLFLLLATLVSHNIILEKRGYMPTLNYTLLLALFFAFSNRTELLITIMPLTVILLLLKGQIVPLLAGLMLYLPLAIKGIAGLPSKPGLNLMVLAYLRLSKSKAATKKPLVLLVYLTVIFIASTSVYSTIPFKTDARFILPISFVIYILLAVPDGIKGFRNLRPFPSIIFLIIIATLVLYQSNYAGTLKQKELQNAICNQRFLDVQKTLTKLNETRLAYSGKVNYLIVFYSQKQALSMADIVNGNLTYYALNNVFEKDLVDTLPAKSKIILEDDKDCGYILVLARN
jgi:hypothetical protein